MALPSLVTNNHKPPTKSRGVREDMARAEDGVRQPNPEKPEEEAGGATSGEGPVKPTPCKRSSGKRGWLIEPRTTSETKSCTGDTPEWQKSGSHTTAQATESPGSDSTPTGGAAVSRSRPLEAGKSNSD